MFGELGILHKKLRQASVLAKTACHLGMIEAESYAEILEHAEMKRQ